MKTSILRRRFFTLVGLFAFVATIAPAASPLAGFELKGDQWTYRDGDFSIHGVLLKPDGDGPFPGIVISHGLGGNAQNIMRNTGREFVKMGFVCIATDYTHNTAAAMKARQPREELSGDANAPRDRGRGQHPPDFGASAENVKRVRKCVEILKSQTYVDPRRIAAYGHSMGAFLTIAATAEDPARFRAAAITAGGISGRPGLPAPSAEVAAKVRTPFLILHGSIDRTVRPMASEQFKVILDRNGVANQRQVFEGVDHDVQRVKAEECLREMRVWFAQHGVLTTVKDKPAAN